MSVEEGVEKDSGAVSLTLKEALEGTLEEEEEEEGMADAAQAVNEVVQREEDG